MSEDQAVLAAAAAVLGRPTPLLDARELLAFVQSFLDRREVYLQASRQHGSPLYVLEEAVLLNKAAEFRRAFQKELPSVTICYAVKSNNCPEVASILVQAGLGLDVSSGRELELALACGASEIVFTGPGKTEQELRLALRNSERVRLMLDSFAELGRLEQLAAEERTEMRVGVRLTTDERGLWRKFGIPLCELGRFMDAAETCRHVRLRGLQFHSSWNLDPSAQVKFLSRLGSALKELHPHHPSAIEFLDIGGGFWPLRGEWLQPAGTPEGKLRHAARGAVLQTPETSMTHHCFAACPIEEFARQIGAALRSHVFPHVQCRILAEPGRWLCNDAMHILLTVMDRKGADIVVTDGGTNAVGWERFETDYFPVLNLSRPSTAEHPCYVLGSLCTPHDVWGYAYHGDGIEPGDVLLIPTQGAYTYSLRQEFIKPLPKLAILNAP
jgi:diaminopimelate decarboxylase